MTDARDCDSCPLVNRRTFMRDAALAALALSSVPAIANALGLGEMTLESVTPQRVSGATRSYAVPRADGAQIDHEAQLIVVRWQGMAYVFDLSCPHQHTALRWDDKLRHFKCPKHHSEYQPSGAFIKGRATRGMDRYPVKLEQDQLVVDTERRIRQDQEPAAWEAAQLFIGEK